MELLLAIQLGYLMVVQPPLPGRQQRGDQRGGGGGVGASGGEVGGGGGAGAMGGGPQLDSVSTANNVVLLSVMLYISCSKARAS